MAGELACLYTCHRFTRPTHSHGRCRDHYFRTCRQVRTSVPTFQNIAKQNKIQAKIVIATGGNDGLAEWIIDDLHTCNFICIFLDQKWLSQM